MMVVFPKNCFYFNFNCLKNESPEIHTKVVLIKALFWGSGKNEIHPNANWRITTTKMSVNGCGMSGLQGEFLSREQFFA